VVLLNLLLGKNCPLTWSEWAYTELLCLWIFTCVWLFNSVIDTVYSLNSWYTYLLYMGRGSVMILVVGTNLNCAAIAGLVISRSLSRLMYLHSQLSVHCTTKPSSAVYCCLLPTLVTVSFGLHLRGYVSLHAHTPASVTEVSLPPVLVYGTPCHHIRGRTWIIDISSQHWRDVCLDRSWRRCIVTKRFCAPPKLTYLLCEIFGNTNWVR